MSERERDQFSSVLVEDFLVWADDKEVLDPANKSSFLVQEVAL